MATKMAEVRDNLCVLAKMWKHRGPPHTLALGG